MSREVISSGSAPAAVGPYSQGVLLSSDGHGAGGLVFCSGQVPLDPATGQMVSGSIEEATERCLLNLETVLKAAGCRLADAVQVQVFMTDLGEYARMNAVYERFFPKDPPARVCVQVAALPKGAPVEIALVAACGEG